MAVQSAKDVQLFTGVMDADTELRLIKPGDYKKLLNGRSGITNQQNYGAVEDVEGNFLVSNPYFTFAGTNKVIGSYEDLSNDSIIYFVYNSLGYHGIYRFYPNKPSGQPNTIEKIYKVEDPTIYDSFNKSPLNFQEDHLITGVNLVDNLLLFNDGYNQPKQIDIVRANETDKKRKYDFYINPLQLQDLQDSGFLGFVPYDFIATVAGVPSTHTFNYVFGSYNISDVVSDLVIQINNQINIPFVAYNRINYIEIEFRDPGQSTLSVSTSGSYQCRVLANNFYNNNLPEHFFNKIQFPPFCRPKAEFIPIASPEGINPAQLSFSSSGSIDWDYQSGNFKNYDLLVGIGSELNDSYSQITLGAQHLHGGVFTGAYTNTELYNNCTAYFTPRPSGETISIGITYSRNYPGPFGGGGGNSTQYFTAKLIGVDSSGNRIDILTLFNYIGYGVVTNSVSFQNINIPAGYDQYRFFVYATGNYGFGSIDAGFITFGSATQVDVTNLPKNETNMFRAKYIFENHQKSVYGQATSIILRTQGYLLQDQISVNYRDKFLSDDNFASRIKQIVLSYSQDNGVTWFDYDTLDPWQFACEGNVSIFDNTKLGVPVSESEALIQYHSVPLSARSQEYADDRCWDGGIVEGYDAVNVDFEVEYVYNQLLSAEVPNYQALPISLEGFKIGHIGYIGIVYYDDFDRKCAVCLGKNSKITFKTYDELYSVGADLSTFTYVPTLKVYIKNEPPSWATKYRLVRTKDFSQTSYLFWRVNSYATVDESLNVSTVNKVYYRISLDNITYYVEKAAIGAKIEYTYQVGDRLKLITDATGLKIDVKDVIITGADTNYIYIKYDVNIPVEDGSFIEIYSKNQTIDPEEALYYECGECYEIKTANFNGVIKKYHSGSPAFTSSDQSFLPGNISIPAIIGTNHGGTYYRFRKLFRYVNEPAYTIDNTVTWVPSNFADEYTVSRFDGLTRPNTVSVMGRIERNSTFRFSNKYISGTNLNGLNEYEPLNELQFSTTYGWLNKMQLINNDVLRLIFSNSYQLSVYVSQGVIQQSQGDGSLISLSQEVAGNSHLVQRTLGTQNPESVYINDEGDVFGFDEREGVVWRSSGNGLIQVSDYKQKTTFKNWSNQRAKLNKVKSHTPAVYDIYHDEYILTANDLDQEQPSPTCVTMSIIGPGKGVDYTLEMYIEETGQIFSPLVTISGTINPNDYIKSIFDANLGWTTQINPDGSVTACTFDTAYIDKTFVVNFKVLGNIYGPELFQNNYFTDGNTLQGSPWYYVGFDIVSFGNTGAFWTTPESPNRLYQNGLGLRVGDVVEIRCQVEMTSGQLFPILGEYTRPFPPAILGVPIIATGTYSQTYTYTDDGSDSAGFITQFGTSDVRIIWASIRKVYQQPSTIYKFRVVNGYIGSETAYPSFVAETIAFNKQKNGWTQYHSFTPEFYGRLRDQIVSYKDGQLWVHGGTATPKNYYGVQYGRELTLVTNSDFPKVKQFKGLSITGLRKNSVPELIIPPYEGVPTGMESELTESHFNTAEGIQYAAIQKDKLTPGYANTDQAWVNGRNMVGQVMTAKIVNNEPITSVIYSVDILYFYSENS